jgi:Protein of unknown function (DUF3987)
MTTRAEKEVMMSVLLRDVGAFATVRGHLSHETFDRGDNGYAVLWKIADTYYDEHGALPEKAWIGSRIKNVLANDSTALDEVEQEEVEEFLDFAFGQPPVDAAGSAETIKTAKKFLTERLTLRLQASLIEGGYMAADAPERIAQAQQLLAEIQRIGEVAEVPEPPDERDMWRPFPTAALPGRMAQFVREATRAMGLADDAAVAMAAMTAAGAAIGTTCEIEAKKGFCQYPIIWTALILPSGERKSDTSGLLFERTKKIQHLAVAHHETAQQVVPHDEAQHAMDVAQGHTAAPPPPAPELRHIFVADATMEAISKILAKTPRGLIRIHDELAGFVGASNQDKNGKGSDMARMLESFEGRADKRDRAKDGESTFIPRFAVWVSGTIQPSVFWRAMGGENEVNGFMPRFWFAQPPTSDTDWTDDEIDDETKQRWEELITYLYGLDFADPASIRSRK